MLRQTDNLLPKLRLRLAAMESAVREALHRAEKRRTRRPPPPRTIEPTDSWLRRLAVLLGIRATGIGRWMMRVPMLLFVAASTAPSGADIYGRVVTVKDGDTITVETSDRKIITVRIAAIDAPELKQAFGQQARGTLRTLIIDKTIQVQWNKRDRDR